MSKVDISEREWEAIEELYMHCDVTWYVFLHAWKRMNPVRWALGRNKDRRAELRRQRLQLIEGMWDELRPLLEAGSLLPANKFLNGTMQGRLLRAGFEPERNAETLMQELETFLETERAALEALGAAEQEKETAGQEKKKGGRS